MRRWAEHMAQTRPDLAHLRHADLGTPDESITLVLDSSAHLGIRERAIAAHATQTSPFHGLPEELRRAFLTREHLVEVAGPGLS
jgi:N-acetyl-1-D-myo-inositol-2-amino-2-deoxy-alpha-D-glucopyranoside deacetylase